MRGSPLLRALVCFCLLLGLWPVVRKVTAQGEGAAESVRGSVTEPQNTPSAGNVRVRCRLELTVTGVCRGFEVLHLGSQILQVDRVEGRLERELDLEFPEEGVDLVVGWEWAGNKEEASGSGENAARIRLWTPGDRMEERTVWGTGRVEEVLSFGGKGK